MEIMANKPITVHRSQITGQLQGARRLFDSRECALFQAFPAATVSSRVDYPELKSARGTGREQDGFQPAAGDRRVRPGGRGPFARDRPTDEPGFAFAPVRARPRVRAGS